LKDSISFSASGPRRLASCSATRSSRQLVRGDESIGCHCSSTMPSTCTGVDWSWSAESSGSTWLRVIGSSARITATVSMRLEISAVGATPASRSAGSCSGSACIGAAASASSGRAPNVGSRRSGTVSKSASGGRSPKAFSAPRRARRSWTTL
jgi:hypothetical protein